MKSWKKGSHRTGQCMPRARSCSDSSASRRSSELVIQSNAMPILRGPKTFTTPHGPR
ncbi:hypothetical protein R1T08_06970 [Streptomyces sp. SBC-4]|nr:hypothetical protein [Streptomyces sp. SBC-4]MDV5144011.1 hypothetical protein [Streptomyces sp. SBC-4]